MTVAVDMVVIATRHHDTTTEVLHDTTIDHDTPKIEGTVATDLRMATGNVTRTIDHPRVTTTTLADSDVCV